MGSRSIAYTKGVFFFLTFLMSGFVLANTSLRHWPVLEKGEKDVQEEQDVRVHELQLLLAAQGYKVAVDGSFGSGTQQALRRFQQTHSLAVTGKTNNPTWEALIVPLHQGSKGPAVKAAQLELRTAGYAVPIDGVFDSRMKLVAQRFQRQTGHTPDGVIGRMTWYEFLGEEDEGD